MAYLNSINKISIPKAYKRAYKIMDLGYSDNSLRKSSPVKANISPVLYHGTCRAIIERWQIEGMKNLRLSLIGDPKKAALFATYKMGNKNKKNNDIVIYNGVSRRIEFWDFAAERYGYQNLYNRVSKGEIIQSLAIFDRDSILSLEKKCTHFKIYAEPDSRLDGIKLEKDLRIQEDHSLIPLKALIASLDLDEKRKEVMFKIYNKDLWDKNFNIKPPFLRKTKINDKLSKMGMPILANELFLVTI